MLPSGPGSVNAFSSQSVAAIDHVSALAEAVGEHRFDLLRFRVRHRIQMRVEPRNEALAESAHDAGGLGPLLVVLKALFGSETGHADVVAGLAVAARVAEIDDVDAVVMACMLGRSDAGFLWPRRCHRHARVLRARRSVANIHPRVRRRMRGVRGVWISAGSV